MELGLLPKVRGLPSREFLKSHETNVVSRLVVLGARVTQAYNQAKFSAAH
jgi:hypothetical protein